MVRSRQIYRRAATRGLRRISAESAVAQKIGLPADHPDQHAPGNSLRYSGWQSRSHQRHRHGRRHWHRLLGRLRSTRSHGRHRPASSHARRVVSRHHLPLLRFVFLLQDAHVASRPCPNVLSSRPEAAPLAAAMEGSWQPTKPCESHGDQQAQAAFPLLNSCRDPSTPFRQHPSTLVWMTGLLAYLPRNLPHHPQKHFRVRSTQFKSPKHPPQFFLRQRLSPRRNIPALPQNLQHYLRNHFHRLNFRCHRVPHTTVFRVGLGFLFAFNFQL